MWGCEFYSPVFLNLFISTNPRFVVQQLSQLINSDHVVVSVFINFQQTQMGILLCTIQILIILMLIGTVFEIIWDIPWENIFKLCTSAVAAEFCEQVHFRIDIFIPHCIYQFKLHWSPWFPAGCTAAISTRN